MKMLRMTCAVGLCAFVFWTAPALAQDRDSGDLAGFAAQWIETERETAHIPGVITALVVNGEVVLQRGFGFADIEAGRPADETTPFRVGSVSKPVTASVALMAMERLGIAPGDDVRAVFADLPIEPALTGPITMHDLLTHSAGFSESLSGQHVRSAEEFVHLEDFLQMHLPPRFEEPGVVITYNDHHTALAGYAVEQWLAAPFDVVADETLLRPLAMTGSTFDQREIFASDAMARSYAHRRGTIEAYAPDLILTPPAAGFATTAADMGRYLEALLSDPRLAAQHEVQFENDTRLRGRGYGFVETTQGGHLVLYKDGQANGFGARLVIVPELGLGMFVAINRSVLGPMGRANEAGRFLRSYTSAVLDAAIPGDDHASGEPVRADGVALERYVGTYRTTVAARHSWELLLAGLDTARVEATETGGIALGGGDYVPVGDDLFQWHEGGPYYIGFTGEENGRAKYLLIGGGSYERVPWYGVQDGAGIVLLAVLGIAFMAALLCGGLAITRRSRVWTCAVLGGAVLRLAFAGTLGATFYLMDPQEMFYGMPPGLSIAVGLALAAIAFDAAAFLGFARSKTGKASAAMGGFYFASAAVFVWWLSYWNLLGWQVG